MKTALYRKYRPTTFDGVIGQDVIVTTLTNQIRKGAVSHAYLFTGSRITGGFCVTRKGLLLPSKLGHILTDMPVLMDYTADEGAFLPYKGRWYGWTAISPDGMLTLSEPAMQFLKLAPGMELLSIRSSDIAFTMGAKGPLLEKAANYPGEIPVF